MASEIVGAERDAVLWQIIERVREAKPHADPAAWERCWADAAARFKENPSAEELVPEFIRAGGITRLNGSLMAGDSELEYVRECHRSIGRRFVNLPVIYEFGCGTGFNLVSLSQVEPQKSFCGFDLSKAAVALVREAGRVLNLPIGADRFDMREPRKHDIEIPPDTGVFTFGAMEQVGDPRPFIDWLIEKRAAMVYHIEPVPELLDESNLLDWLSLQFHKRRGYTTGMLPYLQDHRHCELVSVQRSHFGSMMLESYARIVWRPL